MILATIEGSIGVAVVALILAVIRWFSNRSTASGSPPGGDRPVIQRSAAALGAKNESEEERMRRFLEALGLPTDSSSEDRRPTPPPLRPPPRRESKVKPVPPIVAGEPSYPKRQVPAPRDATTPQRQGPKPQQGGQPRQPVYTPSLQTRVEEIQTHVPRKFEAPPPPPAAVIPVEGISTGSGASAQSESTSPHGGEERELWREALRSPEGLRSAFILQEILSSPRGLQSNKNIHSFPSL